MARKAHRKATPTTAVADATVKVKVETRVTSDIPSYYINHADVSNTPHEFTMNVGKIPPRITADQLKVAQATGKFVIEPILQLIIPPTLVPGLIRALSTQQEAFEKVNGKIHDPSAKTTGNGS